MITFVQSELGACGFLRLSGCATNINYEVIVLICFEAIRYTYMYCKVFSTFVTNIFPRDWCRAYRDKAAIEKAVLVDWCKALNLSSQYRYWSTILSEKSFTISLLIYDFLEEEFTEHWIAMIQSIKPTFHQNYFRKLDKEKKEVEPSRIVENFYVQTCSQHAGKLPLSDAREPANSPLIILHQNVKKHIFLKVRGLFTLNH